LCDITIGSNTPKIFSDNKGLSDITIDSRILSLVIFPGIFTAFSKTRPPYTPDFLPNFSYIYTWELQTDTHRHPAPVIQTFSKNYFLVVLKTEYTTSSIWMI